MESTCLTFTYKLKLLEEWHEKDHSKRVSLFFRTGSNLTIAKRTTTSLLFYTLN